MAAPTYTPRMTPSGAPLKDGYRSLITIAADSDITLWEKGITPPGQDGGEPIDQTTMHSQLWRQMAPRSLVTLTECTARCAYLPSSYQQLVDVLNVETTISVLFPNGWWMAFFGFMQSFAPDELVEGTQPEATVTFMPTNWDYSGNVEAGPSFGTGT